MSDILKDTINFTNDMESVDEDTIVDAILRIRAEFLKTDKCKAEFEKIKRGEGDPLILASGHERVRIDHERVSIGISMEDHKVNMITLTWYHYRSGTDAHAYVYFRAGIQPDYAVGNSEYVLWTPDGRTSRNFSKVILEQSPYTFNLGMCKNVLLEMLKVSPHNPWQFEKHYVKQHEYYYEMYSSPESWMDISSVVFDGDFDGVNEHFRLWHNCTYLTCDFFTRGDDERYSVPVSRALAAKHLYSMRTLNPENSDVLRDDIREHSYTERDLFTRAVEGHGFCNDDVELFSSFHAVTHSTIAIRPACMFALTYLSYAESEFRQGLVVRGLGPCCLQLLDVHEYRDVEKFYEKKVNLCRNRKTLKTEKRAKQRKEAVKVYLDCDLEFD